MENFIGTGLRFPIEITDTGSTALVSGKELIRQSIKIILSTTEGTRFFLGEFGSQIERVLFQPNDEVLQSLLQTMIREALKTWETRITVTKITFEYQQADTLRCFVYYTIVNSSITDSTSIDWKR
jgi:phage baseplate assembly protein W